MPYGLQDCSSGSNQSYPSSHSQARDFSLARYSRIAQVFIDKEVVFSTFACSPCSRRSSYFLASAFPQAEFRLCRHKPLSIFTICFSDGLELKPLPSEFHRSRGCGAFGLFFCFPPPPAACFRFAAGRGGGLSLWGLAPRTYSVSGGHITDILILLYLYNSFVICAPPHIRAGEKLLQSLGRRQICAVCGFCARRVNIHLKQKTAVKRIYGGAAKDMEKPPAFLRGAGVKLEGKRGAGGGENSFNHLLFRV